MKFLICFSAQSGSKQLSAHHFTDQDFGIASPNAFSTRLGSTTIIGSGPLTKMPGSDGSSTIIWDGAFISDNFAYSNLIKAQPPVPAEVEIERYLDQIKAGGASKSLSGIFGAARVDEDSSFIIAPDPLSQYAFFHVAHGGQTLISNSLHLIEKACQLLGFPVGRDFTSNAFEAAFGVGGWTKTGLKGVEKLLPGHALVGSTNGVRQHRFHNPWREKSGDYHTTMQTAAAGLKKRVESLSRALPDQGLVLDLSGGKDTRLMLSSFLGCGIKNFHVFTGGAKKSSDRQIANALINRFGLKRSEFLSNVAIDEDIDPVTAMARAAYRSMGTSNLFHTALGSKKLMNVAQVRGGCAEGRTKSFFASPDRAKQRKMLNRLRKIEGQKGWSSFLTGLSSPSFPDRFRAQLLARGKRGHDLFTQPFLKEAALSFQDQLEWLTNEGIGEDDLADAYYVSDRGWRHGGFPVQVMNDCRPTFEPLSDVRLLLAQSSLPKAARENAKLVYDLMNECAERDLLEIPFADTNWPLCLGASTSTGNRERWLEGRTAPVPADSLVPTPGVIEGLHNLGKNQYMQRVQQHFLELADGLSKASDVWGFLDREAVLQAIKDGDFATDKYQGLGPRLYYGLVWMTGQEDRSVLE